MANTPSTIETRVQMDKLYTRALSRSKLSQHGPTPADKAAIAISRLRTTGSSENLRSAANWFLRDNFSIAPDESENVQDKIAAGVAMHLYNNRNHG